MSKSFNAQLRAAFNAGVRAGRGHVSGPDIEGDWKRFRDAVADGPDDQPVPVPDDEPTSSNTYWHWD